MNKFVQVCMIALGLLSLSNVYADECDPCEPDNCLPVPCSAPQDECWCLTVQYEPSYYPVQRCVEEQVPYEKQCVRYVMQPYEVQRCRYVPEYYTETLYRSEPEYYTVQECRTRKKWVTEQQCEYKPVYCWQHTETGECVRATH